MSNTLRVLMRTHFGRNDAKDYAIDDFTEYHQKIVDTAKKLFQAVPVIPNDKAKFEEISAKATQSYYDTAELRSTLTGAIDEFGKMLRSVWGDSELPVFIEEAESSNPLSTGWIFEISDESLSEIESCQRELNDSDRDLDDALWCLQNGLGLRWLVEVGFFCFPFGDDEDTPDNSELRNSELKEFLEICDKQYALIKKIFNLASQARDHELAEIVATKAARAVAMA